MPSHNLVTLVKDFEAKTQYSLKELEQASYNLGSQESQKEYLYAQMGWREKYLWGYLWGDRQLYKDYKRTEALVDQFTQETKVIESKLDTFKTQSHEAIHLELKGTDQNYITILKPHEDSAEAFAATNRFLRVINNALSEIDDAETYEYLDLASDNIGISALSYMENEEAEDAIKDIKRAAPAFEQAIEKYDQSLKNQNLTEVYADIGDFNDFIFDIAFDLFDFTSIMTLSALGDAESKVRHLKSQVNQIKQSIQKNLTRSENALFSYRERVKEQCLAL